MWNTCRSSQWQTLFLLISLCLGQNSWYQYNCILFWCQDHKSKSKFFFPAKSFWCWIILCIYGIIWKRASRKNQIFFSYFFPSLHFRKVKRSFRIFLVKWKHCPWQICQKKTSKSSWSSWELMCWQRTTVLWTKSFPEQKLHHERCENRMQLLRRLKIFFPYISRTLTFLSCSFWTLIFHTDLCRLFFLDCIFL